MSTEELNDAVRRALAGGIAVSIHAIGDAANRRVLDAIELALADERRKTNDEAPTIQNPKSGALGRIQNRIEHAQIVHPRDIPRFAQLGVIASMQPIHAISDMETADQLWGERCATAYAWRALQDAGATLAFGSDAPVESLNPWLSVHAAVTRQRPGGLPAEGWYPEQRVDITSALRGFTAGAAMAAGAAHEQGTLMPGMLADLAVLSADPFKINPANLHAVSSELTMIEGEVVWEKKG
jgi:predicted amidohydrolase YtcJ